MTAPSARSAATRVLHRVAEDEAWASLALDAEIARAKLDPRDAGLATEIAYGALRVLPRLDEAIDRHLDKPKKLDSFVRAALRAGAYQLLYLCRVPAHAAVSETVSLVKAERGPRLGGLVNAVLRKIAKERPADPSPPSRMELAPWIIETIRDGIGDARAEIFLRTRALPPPIGLRAVRENREALARSIAAARPEAQIVASEIAPRALSIRGAGDPRTLPGHADGAFAVQEIGSQLVLLLAGAKEGESIADLCAGHGTKSLALAEQVGARGAIVSIDRYEEKLEKLQRERARLQLRTPIETHAIDLAIGSGGFGARFDRVIVDAPCTGLGTIHRRPEIALRMAKEDPARLGELQLAILRTAVSLVRPGGTLVYAVCSPARAEGASVAHALEAAHPELARSRGVIDPDEDGIVRIGPWIEDADAYQVARWIRA